MNRLCLFLCLATAATSFAQQPADIATDEPISVNASDWPWWRGPDRNGIAAADQHPPIAWSDSKNVLWKNAIPGRGHGSATVVGDRVFLATADHDRKQQLILCFDREAGKPLWRTVVHQGGLSTDGNEKASQASSTVASDGSRIFISFLNRGAIYTTALRRDGQLLWQTKITDYVVHQGYGASPALYESLVIVTADNKGGGAIAALDRGTGRVVWKRERPKKPNYSSPVIQNIAGRDQLLLIGCDLVTSFDPLSGEQLWEIEGATTECVTSTVTDGPLMFTSGGYPKNHLSAVRADGSGEVVWQNNVRVYVPSLLARDGYLYCVTDAGIAMCWKSATGEEVWKGRLGGTFSASPVLVGEHIFATNESGQSFVFSADPKKFEKLAENRLGDHVMATSTICGARIYMRVAFEDGDRRDEVLYCLGE
jgi:hypothetical protein